MNIRFPLDALNAINLCELARRTKYSVRTLHRWKHTGIPLYAADRIAIRLGVHPSQIWTDWYSVA